MIKLIPQWRRAHKFSSMWLMAIAILFDGINAALDSVGWRFLDATWQSGISIILVAAAMVARLIAQASPE